MTSPSSNSKCTKRRGESIEVDRGMVMSLEETASFVFLVLDRQELNTRRPRLRMVASGDL